MKLRLLNALFLILGFTAFGQNKMALKADFDMEKGEIKISQTIQYKNTTNDTLKSVYLNDSIVQDCQAHPDHLGKHFLRVGLVPLIAHLPFHCIQTKLTRQQ